MTKKVLAVGAHPDDVEFMMAGTLLALAEAGYEPHIFVVASGSCGSSVIGKEELVRTRLKEAQAAAARLGAHFHAPVVDDLEITYNIPLLRKVAAVVRKAQPDIVLTHSRTNTWKTTALLRVWLSQRHFLGDAQFRDRRN